MSKDDFAFQKFRNPSAIKGTKMLEVVYYDGNHKSSFKCFEEHLMYSMTHNRHIRANKLQVDESFLVGSTAVTVMDIISIG